MHLFTKHQILSIRSFCFLSDLKKIEQKECWGCVCVCVCIQMNSHHALLPLHTSRTPCHLIGTFMSPAGDVISLSQTPAPQQGHPESRQTHQGGDNGSSISMHNTRMLCHASFRAEKFHTQLGLLCGLRQVCWDIFWCNKRTYLNVIRLRWFRLVLLFMISTKFNLLCLSPGKALKLARHMEHPQSTTCGHVVFKLGNAVCVLVVMEDLLFLSFSLFLSVSLHLTFFLHIFWSVFSGTASGRPFQPSPRLLLSQQCLSIFSCWPLN